MPVHMETLDWSASAHGPMKAQNSMSKETSADGQKDEQARGMHLVKDTEKGWGVYARRMHKPGQILGFFSGNPAKRDTRHSLTLGGLKIEPTGDLKFLNHSCSANSAFRGRWLIAKNTIMPGEEITIDYLVTESAISHHFVCKCGSETCRGAI